MKLALLYLTLLSLTLQSDFLSEQKRYSRVREAIAEKGSVIETKLQEHELTTGNVNILMVAYKEEDEFLLYAKKKGETIYKKILTYKICAKSGVLGPKRKQGDYQVPEGFYHIDRFNPTSNFHLSLRVNYPNQADRKKSNASDLGGDIYIHGSCVTIGCLPMTDDKIKEIYLYAVHAKNNGQSKIPVYIFPFKMTAQNVEKYKMLYQDEPKLVEFWENLKEGHDKFQDEQQELTVKVNSNGDYSFL